MPVSERLIPELPWRPGYPLIYRLSAARLYELVFEAAGAATGPLLADHPGYTFPSELVAERVRAVLEEAGVAAPVGYRG